MKFTQTDLPGVIVVELEVFRDSRGFFVESFHAEKFATGGIDATFVQDNHSRSRRGTLRGLHAQKDYPQGKLVRATRGVVFDVAVDVREGSPTFGRWVGYELSEENFRLLYIPVGFVHGFCVLSETADVEYKCTDFYRPGDELGVAWNDPEIGIDWPVEQPLLSENDVANPALAALRGQLPRYERS